MKTSQFVRLEIDVRADMIRRIEHLAAAMQKERGGPWTVQSLIEDLLCHLDDAITRSGSWERDIFFAVYGLALDEAASAMSAQHDEPKLASALNSVE